MAQRVDPNLWRGTVRKRLIFVAALFLAWVVAIQARLVYVQVVDRAHWVRKANSQQLRLRELPARRGEIVDRHGKLLASSVDMDRLAVDPSLAGEPKAAVAKLCAALGDCSPAEVASLVSSFRPDRQWLLVRRRIRRDQARRLEQLQLKPNWIVLEKVPWRWYPNLYLAAHAVGTVDIDGHGVAGIEHRYDKDYLSGRPGQQLVLRTKDGVALKRVGEPPVPGDTLELTIDSYLQFETERALRKAVAEHNALAGCALVMATQSGEILAMASEPTYNPNLGLAPATPEEQRNRTVQDAYEPGSTFKVVTATAALEQKVIRPDDIVDTGDGRTRVGNYTVSDTHAHGAMTFREVITKSSNVGAALVGARLGAERLGRYVLGFRFGQRLLPDLWGESAGLVRAPAGWRPDTVQTVAYGYGLSATPLQLAAAVNAIANGGEVVQPRLLHAIIRGNTRTVVPRRVLGRAMQPATAAQLTEILEGVTVEGGTATAAAIEGYTVAGKTGTAQKLVNGRYSATNHRGSFVGFVPSRNPAVTIFVMLDNPRGGGYYGGVVAAPAFKRIAEAALQYLAVPPTVNPLPPVLVEPPGRRQILPVAGPIHRLTVVPAAPHAGGQQLLPELRGMSGRAAVQVLSKLGLSARLTGDGFVTAQDPPPGAPVEPGGSCRLWLSRAVPGAAPGLRP